MAREDRARLQWAALQVDWDGDGRFAVHIPAAVDEWPGRWLERHLPARVQAVAGAGEAAVQIEAATPAAHGQGYDRMGSVVVDGLGAAGVDGPALREAVEQAVDDAYAAAGDAVRGAQELAGRLQPPEAPR